MYWIIKQLLMFTNIYNLYIISVIISVTDYIFAIHTNDLYNGNALETMTKVTTSFNHETCLVKFFLISIRRYSLYSHINFS
jgi:hypothetical protein